MYSLEIPTWEDFSKNEFETGIYLWILHADKIPPHVGISKNGFYYSLKVSGKDEAIPVHKLMHLLDKKSIATVIIKTSENSILCKDLNEVFTKYNTAGINDLTCLSPITEIYLSTAQDLILAELLNLLNEAGVMENTYGMNLQKSFKGIPYYERKDIQQRLDYLKSC